MEDREHDNTVLLDAEEQGIRKPSQQSATNLAEDRAARSGVSGNAGCAPFSVIQKGGA